MKRWYALHTRPYAEKRVARLLARREIETFVPRVPNGDGASGSQFRPLFLGYLFVRVNLDLELTALWLNHPDVRYIVAYDNEPVSIMDEVIAELRRRNAELISELKQGQSRFKPGQLVRIRDGPFRDMLAIFEREKGPKQRVSVLLQALDRAFHLQIAASKLDAVEASAKGSRMKRPRRTRGRGRPIRS